METGEDGNTGRWRPREDANAGDMGRGEGMASRRDEDEFSAWEKRIVTGKLLSHFRKNYLRNIRK